MTTPKEQSQCSNALKKSVEDTDNLKFIVKYRFKYSIFFCILNEPVSCIQVFFVGNRVIFLKNFWYCFSHEIHFHYMKEKEEKLEDADSGLPNESLLLPYDLDRRVLD